ncbi:hypothetical protein B9Z65_8200 [Elsinoe australis]|uniref:Uncharacterized protein n=1 Tax=Elsinoe australis TaxID=40998 RepID=A0A2P7ZMI7_9PEZI|nr:hypothetical protein B9Z65_8200 [Elsinoe australis]
MLIYRQDPANYQRNAKIMRALAVGEAASTVIETIVVMTLFGSLWQQWTLVFKVVTPILHVLFSVAQLHGARIFWGMYLHFDACHREGQGRTQREEEREGESKV